jgi:membrane-bound lytic murein transglycosylase MltF
MCRDLLKRELVDRLQIAAKFILLLPLLCTLSCSKGLQSPTSERLNSAPADLLGSEVLLPEGFSNEITPTPGQLVLPTSFGRSTEDVDQMLERRNIRALVTINPISFFYSHGQPKGMLYEQLEQLERFVNKKYKTRRMKVKISFIPMRPDELGPALAQGVGDFIAGWVVITPGRQKQYAFTSPVMTNVKQVIVTGPELTDAKGLDDLVGTDIYVSPLTSFYEHLMKLNEQRVKAAKPPLSVKPADKNLQEDDLIEMVNAGLIPATAAMQHRANLWEQILPKIRVHPEMVIASEGELAWVMRKGNPGLKKLLDQFTETHGEGTLLGNILLRRYLKSADWVRDSNSTAEMKRFAAYVEYFKKYAEDYHFDYLMLMAQGYQESRLDQSKRSRRGAIGIMQVIPKYAAAPPINVTDVGRADRNILAGVRILNNITTNYFNDPAIDDVNRTLLTFASYNAGPSRMVRLRRKAERDGLNPNKWFGNVELEAAREIGEETVLYVDNVYKYYIAYKLATERKRELQSAREAN